MHLADEVTLDNSALTKLGTEFSRRVFELRFQEKFGMAADVYGEQGMEQVKANEERKKKQEDGIGWNPL